MSPQAEPQATDLPSNLDSSANLRLLEQSLERQAELSAQVNQLSGQSTQQQQQLTQLYEAVRQLYDAVSVQCRQLLQSDQNLQQELQRFQTGGPQRAMAAVFHKLFRDLLSHVVELDEMLAMAEGREMGEAEAAWLRAIRILRDRYEAMLKEWGATPIQVAVGSDEFDPEIHEAVTGDAGQHTPTLPENVITRVRRRGWALHGQMLKPPLVEVN